MTPPKFITLEEHYISPHIRDEPAAQGEPNPYQGFPAATMNKLLDLGQGRLRDLDAGQVERRVISHGGLEGSAGAIRAANDGLAAACRANPTRLAGFAKLPMREREPTAAAAELERRVRQLGFVGALIDDHSGGEFYDAERFRPVFERAQELDVPIYLHPDFAAERDMAYFEGNFPPRGGGVDERVGMGLARQRRLTSPTPLGGGVCSIDSPG